MKTFKDIIVKLRNELGLTQQGLADELNISKNSIAMWETGDRFPSKALYEHIADLFNVDIDYLYGRSTIRKKIHFDNDGTPYAPVNSQFTKNNQKDIKKMIDSFTQLNIENRKKSIA